LLKGREYREIEGAKITEAIVSEGISLRRFSAAAIGRKRTPHSCSIRPAGAVLHRSRIDDLI